jgi:hypothetical protein
MLLAQFTFPTATTWRLRSDGPSLFALSETNEWKLVSPHLYAQLPPPRARDNVVSVNTGECFITCTEIVFAAENDRVIQTHKQSIGVGKHKPPYIDPLIELVDRLLTRLRHLSGQATIPKGESFSSLTFTELDDLPVHTAFAAKVGTLSFVREYELNAAITAGHVGLAAISTGDFVPPTHEVIFLDAVAAHRSRDFRKSILYAGMSMEIVIGTVIDKTYERIIATPSDERFRVISLVQAGGKSTVKDPIYERLRGRHDFDTLISDTSLYVLRRSLLVESQSLYQKVKRLHSTRNKLAHAGVVSDSDKSECYTVDKEGSMAAIETALALFSWLGERNHFPLPTDSFVELGRPDQRGPLLRF